MSEKDNRMIPENISQPVNLCFFLPDHSHMPEQIENNTTAMHM
jgi:hypothetical protein